MYTIGSYEAKTKLPELLRMVEEWDEEIIITRHNKPIARIIPEKLQKISVDKAIHGIKSMSKKIKKSSKKQSIKKLINEGRKY
jgi:prevent-host-death family protein